MIEKNRGVYHLRRTTSPYLSSWMATSAERSSEVCDSRSRKYCFVDSTSCSQAFLSCVRAVCTSLEHCTYTSRSHEWIGMKHYERGCGQHKYITIHWNDCADLYYEELRRSTEFTNSHLEEKRRASTTI